jgi:hypothetical protein
LTVIHTPAVALAGKTISGEEVWPSINFLSPIGWPCPDGPLYPFAGSIAASSHEFSSSTTMQCTLSRLHESVVLGYEDLSTFSLSWMVYDGQISPTNHPFVTSNVVAILDSISTRFIGAQCRWNSVAPNMAFLFLSYFATSKKQTSCQSALQPSPRSFRICVCSAGAGVGCFPQGLHMLATDVCLSAIMSLFECSER